MSKINKYLAIELVQAKIQNWCAYQERSHFELEKKLFEFELTDDEKLLIISSLTSNNFINEERFALAFTRGKFKIKNWGKLKIQMHLKQHKVSQKLINQALDTISDQEYITVINKLINLKLKSIKSLPLTIKKHKLINFLQSKGYEFDVVLNEINKIKI